MVATGSVRARYDGITDAIQGTFVAFEKPNCGESSGEVCKSMAGGLLAEQLGWQFWTEWGWFSV